MVCNDCNEEWDDDSLERCPFCGSENISLDDDEYELEDDSDGIWT